MPRHSATPADLAEGRFSLVRQIGVGSSGVVFEAFDRERKLRVALKLLRRAQPEAIHRFKIEFRALQGISHGNLITLGELMEADGSWFFTMEYVDGVDFLTHVSATRTLGGRPDSPGLADDAPRFDEPRLRDAFAQLARGLDALHRAGKVHRDVKPSNVLVSREGRVVLLDFGLVATARARSSTDEYVVGTVAYMAPEQAAARAATPASDWYSAGVMLYQALTGALPIEGDNLQVLIAKRHAPPPPGRRAAGIPADLDALCAALLRPNPVARPTATAIFSRLGVASAAPGETVDLPPAAAPAPFTGRARELASLAEAFADTTGANASNASNGASSSNGANGAAGKRTRGRARPIAVCVSGPSGVGKSALVEQFAETLADEAGDLGLCLVLRGRCYEHEAVHYKAFDGVVDDLAGYLCALPTDDAVALVPDQAHVLARVFPVLSEVEAIAAASAGLRAVGDPHELRRQAFAAMRELLSRVCERARVVLVLHDLQWADADSLRLLDELTRPPAAPPLLVLATSRIDWESLWRRRLPDAPVAVDARDLALGPLADDDARALAAGLMSGGRTGDAAAEVAREAGGHPLFIAELARHVATAGAEARRATLDEVLGSRVAALPAGAVEVIELLALADAPLPWEALRLATELDPDAFADAVRVVRDAGLVVGSPRRGASHLEPFHDRLRQAALARMDAPARARGHRRIARALEATGAADSDPQALVRQLERAGEIEPAARLAVRAARLAASALAFDTACELFRAALRLRGGDGATDGEGPGEDDGGDDGDRADGDDRALRVELAHALAGAGRGAAAAKQFLLAARGADPATRRECRTRASEHFLASGHVRRGLAILDALLTEAGIRHPATRRGVLAQLAWHRLALRARGLGLPAIADDATAGESPRESPRELIDRIDLFQTASKIGMVDLVAGALFHTLALRTALACGEPVRLCRLLAYEASLLMAGGPRRIARGRELLARARAIGSRTDDPALPAWLLGADAMISIVEGRFSNVVERARDAEEILRRLPGMGWELSTARILQVWGFAVSGRLGELSAAYERAIRDAVLRGDRYAEATLRANAFWLWLGRDDVAGARAALERATWTPPPGAVHFQSYYVVRARAEIALYEASATGTSAPGDHASALAELERELAACTRNAMMTGYFIAAEARWVRARLLLAQIAAGDAPNGDGGAGPDSRDRSRRLRAAARLGRTLARGEAPFDRAWGALIQAGVAWRRGRRELARDELVRAAELSDAAELSLCAAAARWWLAEPGEDDARPRGDRELADFAEPGEDDARPRGDRELADYVEREGVARPDRLFPAIAPGLGRPTR